MKLLLGLAFVLAACGSKSNPPAPPPGEVGGAKTCMATGCGGTICASEQMMSTCEFKPEHACYSSATCEWQASGECGWRQTPELTACLANPPAGPDGEAPGTPSPM